MDRSTRHRDGPSAWTSVRRIAVSAVLGLAAAEAWGPCFAQSVPADPRAEGLPLGPWQLKASLVTGYSHNSNVFSSATSRADEVLDTSASLRAALPFGMSVLELGYRVDRLDYRRNPLDRNYSHEAGVKLDLRFSTSDRLELATRRLAGLADYFQFDTGGEAVFKGQGYVLDEHELRVSREEFGRRGYVLRAKWSELSFPPDAAVAFFEYRGLAGSAEYREPLSPGLWLVLGYEGIRLEHLLAAASDAYPGVKPGDPFRKEKSDRVDLGLRGRFGRGHEFSVALGGSHQRFPDGLGTPYRGLVANASVDLKLGASTALGIDVARRPYPSFYGNNDYYLLHLVTLHFEHRRPGGTTIGGQTGYYLVDYPDALDVQGDLRGLARSDRALRAEVYANLMIRPRVGFRLSVARNQRTSNEPNASFSQTVLFAGIALGWLE